MITERTNSMPLKKIQSFLLLKTDDIAENANKRTFEIVKSYRTNKVSPEESLESTKQLIHFIIEGLGKDKHDDLTQKEFIKEIVSFKEGIASKRVDYKVDLVDLLLSINIVREEIWNRIREESICCDNIIEFFTLERILNTLFDSFIVEITEKFLAIRDELISSQSNSLKMWEEVVKSTSHLDLKIPCRGEFVVIARAQAEAIARRLNFDNEAVDDLVLAIGEVCDNAIEHGYSEKGVNIHYTINHEELIVEIIDYGKGFNPEGKGEEIPDLMNERGRGIFITKQLADDVTIQSKPGEGTKVTIRKKRVFL